MTLARICRIAALALGLSAPLGVSDAGRSAAAAAQTARPDAGAIVTVARKSTRPARRGRARSYARRPAQTPRTAETPLPRPKPGDEAAAAAPSEPADTAGEAAPPPPAPPPAAGGTQSAARTAPAVPAMPTAPAAARAELRALYGVNALSYRCNFELTTREGAVLDRSVTALEAQLKLDTQAADALFSDVDLALYGDGGGDICRRGSPQEKSFRATLARLLGG